MGGVRRGSVSGGGVRGFSELEQGGGERQRRMEVKQKEKKEEEVDGGGRRMWVKVKEGGES